MRQVSVKEGAKNIRGEIKMKVNISKVKNHEHIIGDEFEKVFEKPEWAMEEIKKVIDEFERNININGLDLEGDDLKQIDDVLEMKEGFYTFDCGDFFYYIEIKGGNENKKAEFLKVANGRY